MLRLDHLAVTSQSLEDGVDHIESALGVKMAGGGKHPHMATHNRLLGLGDLYLEAIAPDPAAQPPNHPRWFGLDHVSGPPRLTFWVANCAAIGSALQACPPGFAPPIALERGDFRWLMAASSDGSTPIGGGFPALIQWVGDLHPTQRLPDTALRLTRLEIAHPEADALTAALARLVTDPRIAITHGPTKAMRATFSTPHGLRFLE